MRRQQNNKAPIPFGSLMIRIALVLLCLVMFSTYLMAGLYARYATGSRSGDSARVAGFDVKVTGSDAVLAAVTPTADGTQSLTLTVENDSEVAVRYSVRVQMTAIDAGKEFDVKVTLDETEKATDVEAAEPVYRLDFGEQGTLPVGPDVTAAHTLTFDVANWAQVTRDQTGNEFTTTRAFTIWVDVVQID